MRLGYPFASVSLEAEIRASADVALASGVAALKKMGNSLKVLSDPLCRIAFFRAAHAGFVRGQTSIINRILSAEQGLLTWQDELTFRKIIDAIAWQLLSRQLYIARRLCRERRPIPLRKRANLQSVVDAATHWHNDDFTKFALISDASTFIHVGDLLVSEPLEHRLWLAEVKTGEKNKAVLDFLYSMSNATPEQLDDFMACHGVKGFEQLGRAVRQTLRMLHVAQIVNTGESRDPDSSLMVRVSEEEVEVETYDLRLSQFLDSARHKKWAIDIIDDCLVVGVFRGSTIQAASHGFRSCLRMAGWKDGFPTCNLVESMVHPLALPLFSRELSSEHTFDILFGRTAVFMGLHVDNFARLSNKVGLPMRWSSRKEAAPIPKSKIGLKVDKSVLMAREGEREMAVGGGSVLKIFFHGLTPRFAIELLGRQLAASRERAVHEERAEA